MLDRVILERLGAITKRSRRFWMGEAGIFICKAKTM